ncbi:threonine export protein RhtC [Raoultella ornithinolytica]|jgi:threonine efflux protein|uniref:Threonine export protein RhtC n=1 Tax=Raoultella ornithinolytica TaxID=54291 RepID=A0ABZ2DZ11_RAOOR|nr:threonine export protein RhtC [Raoultella ornithinolytica]ALQ49149.1 L-lysine permease [Raoultella ornithinolytica]EHT04441.1 threonine efflux protein [Raoultella ornithinolytica 10-5246]EKU2863150.1 threonine export protein RhtC [Raoultella ornithinolytica]EKU8634223.1 threonine export protein RhtC [Raoultella ornithinolytica]ELB6487067.1 threonine export protein RhtC [Raoultella ornithinolytica]
MLMLFLTVALVHIIALMSPGPDFFFVSQTAVSRSRKEALMGVLGITCGVMVWAGVALLGLHLIIEKMAWLHTIIMVGGGLYLCWMGYQMLRGALKKSDAPAPEPQVELARSGRSFLKGLLTNLANPKAIIYFGSVFSLFVGDNVGTGERWGIFLLIVLETLTWFTVVASLFALPAMRRGYQRMAKWIDGIAGTLFAGFGIHLIISR